MAGLGQLSVELHTEILRHALLYSRRPTRFSTPLQPTLEWIDDPRDRGGFPFNAALTCSFWRDILACIPECWTRLVFDVAADPFPILSAFTWTNSLQDIEVLIVTSATESVEVEKTLEKKRVKAVVDALSPHIHRCSSIVVDVMHEASLPSSLIFFTQNAPRLHTLTLKFREKEREDNDEIYGHRIKAFRIPDPKLATSFPRLHKVTMYGEGFFELCMFDRADEWLKELKTSRDLHLHLARFRFLHDLEVDDYITVADLTLSLSKLRHLQSLHLQDVRLEYTDLPYPEMAFVTSGLLHDLDLSDLHFEDVSRDFLSEFFTTAPCYGERTTFTRCAIPRISQPIYGCILTLDSIIPDEIINEDGFREQSLHRILVGWGGSNLIICSCSSFNDDLLRWLGHEVDYTPFQLLSEEPFEEDPIVYYSSFRKEPLKTFPSESVSRLMIDDCDNYSLEQLKGLVDARRKASVQEDVDHPDLDPAMGDAVKGELERIVFRGRHPNFTDRDIEWINTGEVSRTYPGRDLKLQFLDDNGHVVDHLNITVAFPCNRSFYY